VALRLGSSLLGLIGNKTAGWPMTIIEERRAASQKGARVRKKMKEARADLMADECEHMMPRFLCRTCWLIKARAMFPDAPPAELSTTEMLHKLIAGCQPRAVG